MTRFVATAMIAILAASAQARDDQHLDYKELLARNNANVNQLSLGMTKEQVIALMKSYTSEVRDGPISNPYRTEAFQRGSDTYEVLYYLTRPHPPFTPLRDSQATPIILKNGAVSGWGHSALRGMKP